MRLYVDSMKCQEAIFEVTGQFAQWALRGSRTQPHRSSRRFLFDAPRWAGSVRQSKKQSSRQNLAYIGEKRSAHHTSPSVRQLCIHHARSTQSLQAICGWPPGWSRPAPRPSARASIDGRHAPEAYQGLTYSSHTGILQSGLYQFRLEY